MLWVGACLIKYCRRLTRKKKFEKNDYIVSAKHAWRQSGNTLLLPLLYLLKFKIFFTFLTTFFPPHFMLYTYGLDFFFVKNMIKKSRPFKSRIESYYSFFFLLFFFCLKEKYIQCYIFL